MSSFFNYLDVVYSKTPFGQHDSGAGLESVECVSVLEDTICFQREVRIADLVVLLRCADPLLYAASHNRKICSYVWNF
jgi:hypothetical protein